MTANATTAIRRTDNETTTPAPMLVFEWPWITNLLANLKPSTAGVGLATVLLQILTALANCLVCVAIVKEKRLQNMTNYFFMSLAVTDLMVALLVMPFGIFIVIGTPLSALNCLIYITLDVLLCTCSILHLCTLSVDRYLCLRYPMKFGRNKTRRRVVLKISLVWMTSVATSVPQTLIASIDNNLGEDGLCHVQDRLFMIVSSVLTFYIPLLVMVVVHALTLRLLKKVEATMAIHRSVNVINQTVNPLPDFSSTSVSTGGDRRESTTTFGDFDDDDDDASTAGVTKEKKAVAVIETPTTKTSKSIPATSNRTCSIFQSGHHQHSEKRASKILSMIFLTFVALWTPFYALTITAGACPTCVQRIPVKVFDVAVWLVYASSTANPVIFTIFNPTFRQTFAKLLHLKFT